MARKAIKYPELFKIIDENAQVTHHGPSQQWYGKRWKRMAGCGPTVAAAIYYYLTHSGDRAAIDKTQSIKDWVARMDAMWNVVTPTFFGGVNTTQKFYKPLHKHAHSQGLPLQYHVCDVPKVQSERPEFSQIIGLIETGLAGDSPVAFLNLDNGEEKNLEPWHWVTIVALDYSEDLTRALIEILDEGKIQTIDLRLWYTTTKDGGGFVYFTF